MTVRTDGDRVEFSILDLPSFPELLDGLLDAIDICLGLLTLGRGEAGHERITRQQRVENDQEADQECDRLGLSRLSGDLDEHVDGLNWRDERRVRATRS
jgi:hypothetical protein